MTAVPEPPPEVTKTGYSTFERTGGSRYRYLAGVGEIILYADVDEAFKSEVKSFLDKLGC